MLSEQWNTPFRLLVLFSTSLFLLTSEPILCRLERFRTAPTPITIPADAHANAVWTSQQLERARQQLVAKRQRCMNLPSTTEFAEAMAAEALNNGIVRPWSDMRVLIEHCGEVLSAPDVPLDLEGRRERLRRFDVAAQESVRVGTYMHALMAGIPVSHVRTIPHAASFISRRLRQLRREALLHRSHAIFFGMRCFEQACNFDGELGQLRWMNDPVVLANEYRAGDIERLHADRAVRDANMAILDPPQLQPLPATFFSRTEYVTAQVSPSMIVTWRSLHPHTRWLLVLMVVCVCLRALARRLCERSSGRYVRRKGGVYRSGD